MLRRTFGLALSWCEIHLTVNTAFWEKCIQTLTINELCERVKWITLYMLRILTIGHYHFLWETSTWTQAVDDCSAWQEAPNGTIRFDFCNLCMTSVHLCKANLNTIDSRSRLCEVITEVDFPLVQVGQTLSIYLCRSGQVWSRGVRMPRYLDDW